MCVLAVGNGVVAKPFQREMEKVSRAFPAVDYLGAGLTRDESPDVLRVEVALRVYGVQVSPCGGGLGMKSMPF